MSGPLEAATRLQTGLSLWRRLGPVRGTTAVVRVVGRQARAPFRSRRLQRRPLQASAAEVSAALGQRSARDALRGPVLAALPGVQAFERELDEHSPPERRELIARADALLAHRFNLFGSGDVDLGPDIDWHRDVTSGRRWPLAHMFRVPVTFPDTSDVHVPWELSRFQHLAVLAGAARATGERRYLDEIGRQLGDWIDANPVEFGVNWISTMEPSVRAANWIAALALCAEAAEDEPWFERAVGSLLLHGRFIRRHLDRSSARNNKYLSAIVGLLNVAALFSGSAEGRAWAAWGTRALAGEMEFQVRRDGCAFEASSSYHRLTCELFICGTQAADALGQPLPDRYRQKVHRMLGFVADYTRPDGLAPQIGDACTVRFLPLGDYGREDPRCHLHLFRQAGLPYRPASDHAAYPHGGFYILRGGDLYAIVRCGDVGNNGCGWHAHNDQLAFELALGTQPMVIDPGTYVYTADPAARNLFRSTGFHSTLQVGGAEQNELYRDNVFLMRERSHAEVLAFEAANGRAMLQGRHRGFSWLDPPATHTRRFDFDSARLTLVVEDTILCAGAHLLQWTFPLAAGHAEADGNRAMAHFEGARLSIDAEGLEFTVEEGWHSPSYGVRVRTPFVRARRRAVPGHDVTRFVLTAERGRR